MYVAVHLILTLQIQITLLGKWSPINTVGGIEINHIPKL